MPDRRLFKTMPPDVAAFYHKIVNKAVLNLHAVKHGMFDAIFCNTNDPNVYRRWEQKLPFILECIERQKNLKRKKD